MVPFESGSGHLLHSDCYLCNVVYEIDYPLGFANVFDVLRLKLTLQDYDPTPLLELTNLTLVVADGTQYQLTQRLHLTAEGHLECTVS
jgi:hypothetical protein